ncbi:MAG: hypothetical protein WBN42_09950 [Ignavibacteriaceae bacterium]
MSAEKPALTTRADIQVPGSFCYTNTEIKFVFEGGRELDLSDIVSHEPSRKILLAILGIGIAEKLAGYQELTGRLKSVVPPADDPEDIGLDAIKEAEQQMAAAVKSAEERVKSFQQNEQV